MMDNNITRTRAVGGCLLGFAIAAFAAHAVVPSPPKADSTPAGVVNFLAAHHHFLVVSAYLDSLAVCLLVVAVVGLVALAGAERSRAGTVAVAGVTLSLGLTLALDAAIAAAAATAHRGGGDPVTLFRLADVLDHFFAVPGVLFMGGLGLLLVRSRLVPAVFGWASLAIGMIRLAGGFAGLVSGSGVDEALFMLTALWTIALGITLVARPSRVRPSVAVAPLAGGRTEASI